MQSWKPLLVPAVLAGLVAAPAAASADIEPYQFELKYSAPVNDPTTIVDLPLVAVVVKGNRTVPTDVANQLDEAARSIIDSDPSLASLVVNRRPAQGGELWSIVAATEPRSNNASLIDPFASSLAACLHALPDDVPAAVLAHLMTGGVLEPHERATAIGAGQAALDQWRTDKCVRVRNDIPLDHAKTRSIAEGMLTDRFDTSFFGDQSILDLVSSLNPLFYSASGFWYVEKAPKLRRVFEGAVKRFVVQSAFEPLIGGTFQSFWQWVGALQARRSDYVSRFVSTVASSCLQSIPDLDREFRLRTCIDEGRVSLVRIRLANVDYIAASAGRL